MLATDKGFPKVRETVTGTGYEINRFSKEILFDEKIGATCHLAVAAPILEAGQEAQ
jgi:aminopeptidase